MAVEPGGEVEESPTERAVRELQGKVAAEDGVSPEASSVLETLLADMLNGSSLKAAQVRAAFDQIVRPDSGE